LSFELEDIEKGGRPMVRNVFLTALFIVLVIPALACAHVEKQNLVDVRIVSDSGEEFQKYRAYPRVHQEGKFFYMEAVKGQRYSIQVEQVEQTHWLIAMGGISLMERNQTWNVMSGCTLLERMKRILSKGGEQVWTGRTGSTSPSSPTRMRRRFLQMRHRWGPLLMLSTGKSFMK
jgi:hypothetical protein